MNFGMSLKWSDNWHLKLFNMSVLKQEKFRQINRLLGDVNGKRCLDIGADNGIISFLLRSKGGEWHSADIDSRTVDSIRQLVGSNVFQIMNGHIPYHDHSFDLVLIVDLLEHITKDREFLFELKRVMKTNGEIIINVPHVKLFSLLNRFRNAIGLTDEKHGHVRPGYTLSGLKNILGPDFNVLRHSTYSKTFSELADTCLNILYQLVRKPNKDQPESKKGTVITISDYDKYRKQFLLLSFLYPLIWLFTRLDLLLFFQSGYKLIIKATVAK